MDLDQFRVRFPEFGTADDTLIQAVLDAAAGETSADDLGLAYDEAHGLLAAHKLAISPFGQAMRLEAGKETTYEKERNGVIARIVPALAVT